MAPGHSGGVVSALTAAEEEACLHLQWKLYAIHVRVIKVSNLSAARKALSYRCRDNASELGYLATTIRVTGRNQSGNDACGTLRTRVGSYFSGR